MPATPPSSRPSPNTPTSGTPRADRATLRVAIDAGPLYGHRTGVGVATDGMMRALSEHGGVELDPYLVSFRAEPQPGHHKLPIPGIIASHVWSRFDRPSARRWLPDVDVVHGTNYVAPPSGRPTVISVYDCWFLDHPDVASPTVRRAGEVLKRAVARGAWVHTGSEVIADQARETLRTDRVRVVPLGAPSSGGPADPTDEMIPPIATTIGGRPFVVAIGTEEQRKDIPLLIEAFAELAERAPDTFVVLAGAPGDASERIDAAIGRLTTSTTNRVLRLGPVDAPTKRWLIKRASVLAYPSVDEGFGFPILEAQAAGTPVVARSVGSIPEVGGESVFLVDRRDPADFADSLERALTDTGARLTAIEAGYRNLHRFSWERTADGLISLYRDAIGASR